MSRPAEAYLRGIERRIAAGLNPDVASVASMFISRWDVAVKEIAPESLRDQLGIAVAGQTYETYRSLVNSPPWQRIFNAAMLRRCSRLLLGQHRYQGSRSVDILYLRALAAPFTVNTIPEATLSAFADHGEIGETLAVHARSCDVVLAKFAKAGIDTESLAAQLQEEGAQSFVTSWNELLECIASKSEALRKVG